MFSYKKPLVLSWQGNCALKGAFENTLCTFAKVITNMPQTKHQPLIDQNLWPLTIH
jgi:hypothetical protein